MNELEQLKAQNAVLRKALQKILSEDSTGRYSLQPYEHAEKALLAVSSDAAEIARKKDEYLFSNRVLKTLEKCVKFRMEEFFSRRFVCPSLVKELNIALAAIESARAAGVEVDHD